MKYAIIQLLRVYQRTLSPNHGPFSTYTTLGCKYYPSCSEYMIRAISLHGVLRGGVRGVWRIVRCNPFSHGGVDEPN